MFGETILLTNAVQPPLSVEASPASVSGQGQNYPIQTGLTTASATGGVPPYSYAWSKVSGVATSIATAPNNALTAFEASAGLPTDEPIVETWRVTATDANSDTATFDIDVTFTRTSAA